MGITDFIGGRSEAIAFTRLTRQCRPDSDLPYFWPHYLGEKCESFDFLVELVEAGEQTPYFFVQTKGTRKDFTVSQTPPRLRVEVSEKDIRRMVAFPAPTYVIGVHQGQERAFIVSVHGSMAEAIPSVTTAHELTPETLAKLWTEVRDYWRTRDMSRATSSFPN